MPNKKCKSSGRERNCYDFYTKEEYEKMLCKFGPEGCYVVADKLKEIADKDVSDAIEQSQGFGKCPDCSWHLGKGCNVERDSKTCLINRKLK